MTTRFAVNGGGKRGGASAASEKSRTSDSTPLIPRQRGRFRPPALEWGCAEGSPPLAGAGGWINSLSKNLKNKFINSTTILT